MTFALPHLLWLLLAPVALLGWELTHRRGRTAAARPKILRAEAGTHSVVIAEFKPDTAARRRRARAWLCAGLVLVVVALARPQWGHIEEPAFDQSREILLALDLSRSMLTPDVKPSRLDRGKLLIASLLEKLQGERVGLVVFSGTAFLQSPLSADYEILREFLIPLNPDYLPEGGTNYHALLDTSLQAFGTDASADRFLIILSDGEATDDDWHDRAETLKKKGIRVIGLGVGTVTGAMIPDGAGGFMKDERGAVVLSKLESGTLQELASVTGGVYRDASNWLDLASLLKDTVDAGQKGKFVEKKTLRQVERFQWPLALGLWCLLMSLCYEFPVRPRPRAIRLQTAAPTGPTPEKTSVVNTAAIALLILLPLSVLFLSPPARAADGPPAPSASLSRIVGRLAAKDQRSALDWAELARETTTWGGHLQSEQQPIPESPVRDALDAVELGRQLDPKAADWSKMQDELQALLKKSDEKKDQPPPQDKQDKNQQQQKPDSKKQEQKNQDQKDQQPDKNGSDQPQDPKNGRPSSSDKKDGQSPKPDENQKPPEAAFGDMKRPEKPPQPALSPSETQKVGGQQDPKEQPVEALDPALALPLEKLNEVRNQDSPARLFQLMEGPRKPDDQKKGKDW